MCGTNVLILDLKTADCIQYCSHRVFCFIAAGFSYTHERSDFLHFSQTFRNYRTLRFYKDGSQESVGLVDRIFISADERKIFRIHQWMMEME